MDCVNFEDGGTAFAVGCENGRIFIRIDWEESPRSFDCQKKIHDIKFSSDTFYLIVACDNSNVFIFVLNNSSYFTVHPKKVLFQHEVPISLDFVDDNKSFLVGTSTRNQYKIELPDLKIKNLFQENEKLSSTTWNIRYPLFV